MEDEKTVGEEKENGKKKSKKDKPQDPQSRKWLITINNPADKGFDHQRIREILTIKFKSMVYWCMSDEIGEQGTYHTHVFFACASGVRFSTVKKNFPGAHIDQSDGKCQQVTDYVFKEGKWANDKKSETNLRETHEVFGEMPVEKQGKRHDIEALYSMIKDGKTNYEIMEENPMYMLNLDKVERARQIIREEKYKNTFRILETVYITGATGTGKTRGVMETYGYENVFRVTDYKHPWDNYKGQDVIIFEEFRSSLKVQEMLNLLDGYPLELPCRYANKIACYSKVFIITNIDLHEQYDKVQEEYPETWNAFLRRIHKVKIYEKNGNINEFDLKELDGALPCLNSNTKNYTGQVVKLQEIRERMC